MLSSDYSFIIENDSPANRHKGSYVFGVWQLFICNVMYIFTRHGHWHDARYLLEYPWCVLKLSVSLIMSTENISKQAGLISGPKFW